MSSAQHFPLPSLLVQEVIDDSVSFGLTKTYNAKRKYECVPIWATNFRPKTFWIRTLSRVGYDDFIEGKECETLDLYKLWRRREERLNHA